MDGFDQWSCPAPRVTTSPGKRVSEVIPGLRDTDPELFERYGRVAAGGRSERFEMHVEAMDMWFSIAAYCPEVGRFIAVFDVITDRVLAERALRSANSILERTEAISHVASWRLDLGTGVVTWSREMYRIFGLAVAESEAGDPGLIENAVFPEDRANYEAARASIRAGEPRDMEYRIICTDGSIRWVHAEGELETDDDGNAVSIAGFVQDITERKEAEIALAQAQKMEAVGRLAGGVAHDFNNLLTAIGGYARILEMDLATGTANPDDAAEIRKAADRAAALTARLLAFAGRQAVRPVIMDLVAAIEQMLPMLRRIVPERIQIETVFLPTPPIEADPGEIDQVILNLIVNAADSIPGIGKIRVETTTVEHDGDFVRAHPGFLRGLYARLVVGDTGIGMDGDVRARIFEPFFTTKDRSQGTALVFRRCTGWSRGCKRLSRRSQNPMSEASSGSTYRPLTRSSCRSRSLPRRPPVGVPNEYSWSKTSAWFANSFHRRSSGSGTPSSTRHVQRMQSRQLRPTTTCSSRTSSCPAWTAESLFEYYGRVVPTCRFCPCLATRTGP